MLAALMVASLTNTASAATVESLITQLESNLTFGTPVRGSLNTEYCNEIKEPASSAIPGGVRRNLLLSLTNVQIARHSYETGKVDYVLYWSNYDIGEVKTSEGKDYQNQTIVRKVTISKDSDRITLEVKPRPNSYIKRSCSASSLTLMPYTY